MQLPRPDYYLPIMPYLIIEKVADFLIFMKAVFKAEERIIIYGDEGIIKHGELTIGKAVILFTDATGHYWL